MTPAPAPITPPKARRNVAPKMPVPPVTPPAPTAGMAAGAGAILVSSGRMWQRHQQLLTVGWVSRADSGGWRATALTTAGYVDLGCFSEFPAALAALPDPLPPVEPAAGTAAKPAGEAPLPAGPAVKSGVRGGGGRRPGRR